MSALVSLSLALVVSSVNTHTYYVNNQTGSDNSDGLSEATALRTIARAVSLAKESDGLVLANTGVPYGEPITMRGLGGTPAAPFVIEGNGAVISGLQPLDPATWQRRPDGSWFFPIEPKPYGFPFLVSRGRRLPRADRAETIQEGAFFWGDDGIHFKPEAGGSIESYELEATLIVSGLAVSSSSYIVCRNLVSEYHSNDGFNVHGDCRGMYLENIEGRHNGDDGFSIHETIGAVVCNGYFHHNRWGIQDVNASQSVFNGVRCEHNEAHGASFVGGYHSLVDCVVRDNGQGQIDVVGTAPEHLIGSEFNPLCDAICFLKNVVASGGPTGLRVRRDARVTVEHCIFADCGAGVVVEKGGVCHLTASVVANCTELELDSGDERFFRDHNIYYPGRFRWLGSAFAADEWDAFRAAASHDENSMVADPRLAQNGSYELGADSPALQAKPRIGPTKYGLAHKGTQD